VQEQSQQNETETEEFANEEFFKLLAEILASSILKCIEGSTQN